MLRILRSDSDNPDFRKLTGDLDIELCKIYNTNPEDYEEYNRITGLPTVVLAYENEEPIGCGCFKIFNDKAVEIKRMFIKENQRGKGIASAILAEIENWAKELGYTEAVLETGKGQPKAINLYMKYGYQITENYNQYDDLEISVCLKKVL
ncbi:GNAT family N-acetyltransferase [Dyadobacter frigoris]|uniref:GNAT family N-acetyltransferase n=1 Tax=Dyadobacter frigoris TaxID=2576211 RepID=A0A4U6DD34_9BACT|nr:GNAT family N-acetyltransferase [Dyadobacter frigoris]TKT94208.1 GNAT family N-acetyltransferase [Dyadobacter frigoris]GLU50602.1 N-acetyltransferase [Dyadobacter frigoris]